MSSVPFPNITLTTPDRRVRPLISTKDEQNRIGRIIQAHVPARPASGIEHRRSRYWRSSDTLDSRPRRPLSGLPGQQAEEAFMRSDLEKYKCDKARVLYRYLPGDNRLDAEAAVRYIHRFLQPLLMTWQPRFRRLEESLRGVPSDTQQWLSFAEQWASTLCEDLDFLSGARLCEVETAEKMRSKLRELHQHVIAMYGSKTRFDPMVTVDGSAAIHEFLNEFVVCVVVPLFRPLFNAMTDIDEAFEKRYCHRFQRALATTQSLQGLGYALGSLLRILEGGSCILALQKHTKGLIKFTYKQWHLHLPFWFKLWDQFMHFREYYPTVGVLQPRISVGVLRKQFITQTQSKVPRLLLQQLKDSEG